MTGEEGAEKRQGQPNDADRTVFSPQDATQFSPPPQADDATRIELPGGTTGAGPATAPAPEHRRIRIGDVLNHIFEVRRFIARGGMGEVFEGINVNTEERVAIKVILPHLAAEPSVQAMFRKEARTLTRLSHPGLVQYRVLAQEPQLGALYIVTEYIDGANLSGQLATLKPTTEDLIALLRRLAEGLAAAHALGAIHRDISPDNVMLEEGRLNRAKVIDFGIAKDLEGSGATIVGDGFAGKLNYVAPEQLGDYNRDVGPWTDVYSLGLTILAVALGRDVSMGASLVDAVDKRRAGPDLSPVPDALRPVLEDMLRANPAERLRSMDAVLERLGPVGTVLGVLDPVEPRTVFAPGTVGGDAKPAGPSRRTFALAGGGALLALGVGAALLLRGGDPALPSDPVAAARQVVGAQLQALPCSWLDITDAQAKDGAVALTLRGVSGESAQSLDRIEGALAKAGLKAGAIDFSDVSPVSANMCRPIEAFLKVRAQGSTRLEVAQRKFEMNVLPADAGADAGRLGAQATFTVNLAGLGDEMTLVGLDEAGEMQQMATSKAEIEQNAQALGNGSYRFTLNTTHSGWSGILVLTGKGPFDPALFTSSSGTRGGDWADRFLTLARTRGWRSEMVWYRTVDEAANGG